MYKKSFVSINFTSTKLQFLQLDPTKAKLVQLGETTLTPGVINNYKVADAAALTQGIKNAWRQFGFREQYVGVIVPEFSTFTKTLMLPHLVGHELDEAVRWQAQEFLPNGGTGMILDWKIINSTDKEHQILAVAIQQDILAGFVQATAAAGLYPLVVETPSLSLVRLAANTVENRLIIYANLGEAILISAQGEKIIGSLVVRSSDQKEIFDASMNLIRRYSDNKPERIYIGGLQVSKSLVDALKEQTKIESLWLSHKVSNMDATQMQAFLVPVSLQLKDPSEPVDEHSINLLPPNWVKQYETKKTKVQTWSMLLLSTVIVWTCLFAVVGVYFAMQRQLSAFTSQNDQNGGTAASVQKEIVDINTTSGKVNKILEAYPDPAIIINAINSERTDGIELKNYVTDFEQGYIKISGIASTRAALLEFKNKLGENKDFSEVNLPLSALIAQSDIPFSFEFNYLPLMPKKTKAIPLKQ